jgi:hypothetical protein
MHRSAAPADRPCTGFRVRSLLSTRPTRSDSDPSQSSLPRAIAPLQSSGSLPARHERTAISGRYPAEGCADQGPICSCARREPVADGDRQRAETAAHCRVREDLEHCRAPSAAGAVALRTQAWTKRAGTGAHSCVREDFEHCRALSGAPAAAPAQGPGSLFAFALGAADDSVARSERVAESDRQRTETGAHSCVREDFEHCRALSGARAVARGGFR